jgi:hypothetical protein
MGIVPEPQNGSTSGVVPSHPTASSSAAANDSRNGALATSSRQPRLYRGTPELSTLMVKRSLRARTTNSCVVSGRAAGRPPTGGRAPPQTAGAASAARAPRSAMASVWYSFDAVAVTRKPATPSGPSHVGQAISAARCSSAPKLDAPKAATRTSTRVAVRSHRLAR